MTSTDLILYLRGGVVFTSKRDLKEFYGSRRCPALPSEKRVSRKHLKIITCIVVKKNAKKLMGGRRC